MSKLLIPLIFFLFLFQSFAFTSSESSFNFSCDPQLKPILQTIQKLPEAREILSTIQKEGNICFLLSNERLSQEFGAFWDPDSRSIRVNKAFLKSEGEMIGTILFELQNALTNKQIAKLNWLATCGRINKKDYVRAFEYLEYQNSLNAAKLAQKGIEKGIFPKSARLFTYENFEEHFRVQQMAGHSAWIAKVHDELAPKRL